MQVQGRFDWEKLLALTFLVADLAIAAFVFNLGGSFTGMALNQETRGGALVLLSGVIGFIGVWYPEFFSEQSPVPVSKGAAWFFLAGIPTLGLFFCVVKNLNQS